MGLTTLLAGAHAVKCVYQNTKKRIKAMHGVEDWVDEQAALPRHMRDTRHDAFYRGATLQQVMAMLVDGVYSRDRAAVDFPLIVKPLLKGAYQVDERTEHYTRLHWTRMKECSDPEHLKKEEKVGLRHYLRVDPHPNPLAPRLVIALRGTKLSSWRDIVDDVKIASHTLHYSSRFTSCQELLEELIITFCEEYDGAPGEICITGHSLGAAIALLIARNLATDRKQRYAVHCFNPPFLTLIMLIEKCFLVERMRHFVRKIRLLKPLLKGDKFVGDVAKRVLTHIIGDRQMVMQERANFAGLVDWVPVLYVNKHDSICKEYLRYYVRKHNKFCKPGHFVISSQALVTRLLGRKVKYSSLVPSVNMHISKRSKWPHDLKQWYADSRLEVEVQKFRLLTTPPKIITPIIPDGSLSDEDSASSSDSEDGSSEYDRIGPLLGCTNPSHSLSFLESAPYEAPGTYMCNLCRNAGYGAVYHCRLCADFDLHPGCAKITSEIVSASHPHRMFLQSAFSRRHAVCDGCLEDLDGSQWVYRCGTAGCDFDLHAGCAKYARFIHHPVHRKHMLVLVNESRPHVAPHVRVVCDCCHGTVHPGQLVYHCTENCDFDVHPSCVVGSQLDQYSFASTSKRRSM